MREGFRDWFSRDSASYARFRPRYPTELFQWLATLPAARRVAWDCCTGNGQAASGLAGHFELVVGTDASLAQLRAAESRPGLRYAACLGEASAIAPGSADLITVGQALHWLDRERFVTEVIRAAAPGAALAIWGYNRLETVPAVSELVSRFHTETMGPYWTAERKLVDAGYAGIALPIEEIPAPRFAVEAELTLDELMGYLRTWSAVARYRAAHGDDPVELFEPGLRRVWGKPARTHRVAWPLFVRAGRIRNQQAGTA